MSPKVSKYAFCNCNFFSPSSIWILPHLTFFVVVASSTTYTFLKISYLLDPTTPFLADPPCSPFFLLIQILIPPPLLTFANLSEFTLFSLSSLQLISFTPLALRNWGLSFQFITHQMQSTVNSASNCLLGIATGHLCMSQTGQCPHQLFIIQHKLIQMKNKYQIMCSFLLKFTLKPVRLEIPVLWALSSPTFFMIKVVMKTYSIYLWTTSSTQPFLRPLFELIHSSFSTHTQLLPASNIILLQPTFTLLFYQKSFKSKM